MDKEAQVLKHMIDLFIRDCGKTLYRMKKTQKEPSEAEMNQISERIWNLHHFAEKIVKASPLDESTYYNAKIVKNLTEEELSSPENSLIEAADQWKNKSHKEPIRQVMIKLAEEDKAREVLFEDLKDISDELAA